MAIFFEKLHSKCNVTIVVLKNNVFPTKAQHNILDMGGFRDFSNLLGFPNKVMANNFVSSYHAKQNDYIPICGSDPCLGHCKVLMDMYSIEYMEMEVTFTRSKARTLLKRPFPYKLSS